MKKAFFILFACCAALMFTSCEGPEGPAGPAGSDGTDGTNGTDGTHGVDGNVTCLECHGSAMDVISAQFAVSAHSAGAIAVDYAGGRSYCAPCHSHEQYVQWTETGSAQNVSNPSAWQCKTCHNIHTTFEMEDYAFRKADAVTLNDGTVLDAENNNVCFTCHKARRGRDDYAGTEDATVTQKFTDPDDIAAYTTAAVGPTGTITLDQTGATDTLVVVFDIPFATHDFISSSHAGPHHGPQADIWAGVGGSTAGTAYDSHSGGCVTCHMGDNSGHTFVPKSATCEACHADGTDKQDDMDDIADRIQAVGEALEALHAVHQDDEGVWHPMYASLTKAQIDAWFNFAIVLEDRSNGAHNPVYADALLDAAETALGGE